MSVDDPRTGEDRLVFLPGQETKTKKAGKTQIHFPAAPFELVTCAPRPDTIGFLYERHGLESNPRT
jgi:hypothetical protein